MAVARTHALGKVDAEDAFQEGALKAWTSLSTLERPDRFLPWACTIVARAAKDRGRRERVRAAEPLPEVATPDARGPSTARREAVVRAVEALEEPLREVVELFYFGGLTYREIAGAVDRSVPTVNQRLAEARRRLRAALEATHEG